LPVLHSLVILEKFEVLENPFIIIMSKYSLLQNSSVIGNPVKYVRSSPAKPVNIFTPIVALNTKLKSWVVKARVLEKSSIEADNYSGLSFRILLMDENNDAIQCVFFRESVEIFYTKIIEKRVYLFSDGKIKKSLNEHSSLKSTIVMDERSKVIEVHDDNKIKYDKFNFVDIKTISKLTHSTRVDTFGSIKWITNSTVTSVEIQDQSKFSIQLFCSELKGFVPRFSTILCKNVKYEPNSGILISDSSSKIVINPDLPELKALKDWTISQSQSVAYLYTIAEAKDSISAKSSPDEIEFLGVIGEVNINDFYSFWYPACINSEKCFKKVTSHSDGYYHCSDCNVSFKNFSYRYCLYLILYDCTGKIQLTAFDSVAKNLIELSAQELVYISYTNKDHFVEIIGNLVGKHIQVTVSTKQISDSVPISKFSWISPSVVAKRLLSEIAEVLNK
jgi:replication factor A1